MDDLGDQVQGVLRAQPEPDQRDIGMFPGCGYRDFHDVDLAGDHVVSEPDHDLGKQLQPIASFVRDQDTQMLYVALERRVRHEQPTLLRESGWLAKVQPKVLAWS